LFQTIERPPLASHVVGSVAETLAADLREALALERAVETGTYLGDGARRLAAIFEDVTTIELSEELHARAVQSLRDLGNVRAILGDSRVELKALVDRSRPTFYFLDGHWSAGNTAGSSAECPLLDELAAIAQGHADDCIVIDDARLFSAPPPPPHDPSQWPSLMEIWELLRTTRHGHHLTIAADQIIAVPPRAKRVVDAFGIAVRDGTATAT
jgi:hypothetical protein